MNSHLLRSRLGAPSLAAALAAAALLAGCATHPVGPDYQAPAALAPAQAASAGAFQSAEPQAATAAPLPAHWWRLYQDPLLDALVAQAFAHNTDLRVAVANLERERALDEEVRGAQRPAIGVSGGPSLGHKSGLDLLRPGYQPPATLNYGASVSLSYQLDLFGQIRRAIEASEAGTGASEAALDLVRVNVAAGTARAYAEVCAGGARLQSAQTSVRLQQEAVDQSDRLQRAVGVGQPGRDGVRGGVGAGTAEAVHVQLRSVGQLPHRGHEVLDVDAGTPVDVRRPLPGDDSHAHGAEPSARERVQSCGSSSQSKSPRTLGTGAPRDSSAACTR